MRNGIARKLAMVTRRLVRERMRCPFSERRVFADLKAVHQGGRKTRVQRRLYLFINCRVVHWSFTDRWSLMRALIVEDEIYLAEAIRTGLRREMVAVDMVHDGDLALEYLSVNDYDVVLLDRDIPGLHGDQVCEWVAAHRPECRVLMLTAAHSLGDKVTGFELGADDYLAKPFAFPELMARLRALGRRSGASLPPVLEAEGVRLDTFRREVHRDGRLLRLANKEFAVLELLMSAAGGVLSAETLLEKAWDENADPFTNTVRVTVSNLRKHLGEPGLVHTIVGAGYRFGSPA